VPFSPTATKVERPHLIPTRHVLSALAYRAAEGSKVWLGVDWLSPAEITIELDTRASQTRLMSKTGMTRPHRAGTAMAGFSLSICEDLDCPVSMAFKFDRPCLVLMRAFWEASLLLRRLAFYCLQKK